jgi:hypothetical protein
MVTKNRGVVKGRRLRVTRVDNCGRVIYGENSQAVTKSFSSIAYSNNTLDSDGIDLRDADGEPSIYEPTRSRFASFNIEATMTRVDPEFFSLVTKQRVYLDADGNAIGFAINSDVDVYIEGIAMELWVGAPEGNCDPGQTGVEYGYFIAPFIKGARLGDYTVENGAVTFTLTGGTTQAGNEWGVGPYNVMRNSGGDPSPLLEPLEEADHKLMIWTDVPPPDSYVGWRPVMDPASVEITAIVDVEGVSPTEAVFTLTGATAVPAWMEFGDGTWDWVEDATTGFTHTYAANGTYTVRATTNGEWITDTVVIPYP